MFGLRDLVLIAQTPSSLHQHQQQNQPISSDHPHHPPNLPLPSSSALSVGLGIFPLLTTTHIDHHHHHNNNNNQDSNFWNLKMCQPQQVMMMMDSTRKGVEENDEKIQNLMMGCEENGEFRVCQDCGNRAKKDCSFKRCRTCCKGRGFDCSTHVKSTWTPASMRRDKNGAVVAEGGGDSDGSSGSKRQRILMAPSSSHSSSSNAATTRTLSLDITSSCHQDDGFKQALPRYVTAPAVFKCHRVSGIGSDEDEIAYLATVNINGHIFKGFVYDQGVVDGKDETMGCVSELQLGSNGSGKSNNRECSSAIHVPTTSAYPASAC